MKEEEGIPLALRSSVHPLLVASSDVTAPELLALGLVSFVLAMTIWWFL